MALTQNESEPDAHEGSLRGLLDKAVLEGDNAAMQKLVRSLAPAVLRCVRGVLGRSHPDVDDVTQEALVALIKALPKFRGESRLAGYAARIAARTAVNHAKRQRLRRRRMSENHHEVVANFSPSPSGTSELTLMRQLMAQLPEEQAETLALRLLGYSLQETAECTGVVVNTVRSRVRLAKEALQKRLRQETERASEEESR